MVARLAQRDGDEQPSAPAKHTSELAERVDTGAGVVLCAQAVARVVRADVLERRDEQHLVDALVGKRQRPDIGHDPLHPLDVALGEVDADELDARAQQAREVGRLRERVADFEDAALRDQPRENPRDIDDALLRRRWRLEPRQPLAPIPGPQPERDGVVELADADRLRRDHELVEERRARQRAGSQLLERALARLRVRRTSKHGPERTLDEGVVGILVGFHRGEDEGIHVRRQSYT